VSDQDVRRYLHAEFDGYEPDSWPVAYVDSDDYDALAIRAAMLEKAVRTFRAALARIADEESGPYGWWARDALAEHPELYPGAEESER
jgi:hypothetical protein